MNSNWVTVISSFGAAILGAFVGFKGVKMQMNYEKSLREREEKIKIEKLDKIINSFLKEEIINNFKILLGGLSKEQAIEDFNNTQKIFEANLQAGKKFNFTEFESIKHELLTSNINSSEQIIELYVMFKIVQDNDGIRNLNQQQYDFVKQIYLNNVNSYIK